MIRKIYYSEFSRKLVFTLFMLLVMELGREIVVPGLDNTVATKALSTNPFMQSFSMVTGGNIAQMSLFSVGFGPTMSGMIIVQTLQLLGVGNLKEMSKIQMGFLQKFVILLVSALQTAQILGFINHAIVRSGIKIMGIDSNILKVALILITGAMLISWIADMMFLHGLGGSGILIFPGLVTSIPRLLLYGQGSAAGSSNFIPNSLNLFIFGVCVVIVLLIILFVNRAEVRIPLQRPMLENEFEEKSYYPIRILTSSSMPYMFSTSLFLIPTYFTSFSKSDATKNFIQNYWGFGNWVGILGYCCILILLNYAFAFMNIMPEDAAKNLKEGGDYFIGYTPGETTKRFLTGHMLRLTFISSVFAVIIVGTPLVVGMFVDGITNFSYIFCNLIILAVIMENFTDQVEVLSLQTKYTLV